MAPSVGGAADRPWLNSALVSSRVRIALLVLVGIGVLFRALQVVVAFNGPAWGYDFAAYWHAAERVVAGEPIYSAAQLAGQFSPQEQNAYLYPPFLAVVLAPFTLVVKSLPTAAAMWSAFGLLTMILAAYAVARKGLLSPPAMVVAVGALIALPAVGFEVVMGNVHLVLAALYLTAWLGVSRETRRGEMLAGAAIGVALLIKVFPAVLVVWFLLTRRFTAAASAAVTALALIIATLPVIGIEPWFDYPRVLANIGPPPELWSSIAPASMISEFTDSNVARVVVAAIALLVLVWSARRQPAVLSFSVATMISLLAVPTMYVHYLALAVVPLLLLGLQPGGAAACLLAYCAVFIGSQTALVDLRSGIVRVLALIGALAPLVAALVYRAGQREEVRITRLP